MPHPYKHAVISALAIFACIIQVTRAQSPQVSYLLDNTQSGSTKNYVARDEIVMKPGFVYSASGSNTFSARIDAGLLFPPTENTYVLPDGTITPDSTQGAVVGSIPGQFAVSPSGAATYTIPIECPPGINGMQPSISLVYNSQGGNGIAGWGWNLSGISSITRTGKTLYHDNAIGTVELTTADNLMLDGQRLILVDGSNLTNNAKYRTEIETYSDITCKIINGYLCFEVRTKDGVTMEYGSSADSYIEAQEITTPLTWLLKKVTDTNGNYMIYNYGENNANGEFWLSSIQYTGNAGAGVSPVNEIEFVYYSDRIDTETVYLAGKKTSRTKRIDNINIKVNTQLQHQYLFEYNNDEGYTQLEKIHLKKANDTMILPVKLIWHEESEEYSKYESNDWVYFSEAIDSSPIFADFNGDGKRDFITIKDKRVKLYLNYDLYGSPGYYKKCQFDVYGNIYKDIFVADLNGDGLMDLVAITHAYQSYRYNYYFFDGEQFSNGGGQGYKGFNTVEIDNNYIVGDFNGDGKHEILIKSTKALYNGSGSYTQTTGISNWGDELMPLFPNNLNLLDFTGNGKTNICIRTGNNGYIYELSGSTFSQVLSTNQLNNLNAIYPGDYNGDGKTDLFVIRVNQNNPDGHEGFWLFSTGSSFEKKDLPSLNTSPNTLKGFSGDFNLDGKTDFAIAEYYYNSGQNNFRFRIGVNNGSGFDFKTYNSDYRVDFSTDWEYIDVADYDGDGRSEINYNRYSNVWRIKSFDDSFFSQIKSISNGMDQYNIDYLPLTSYIYSSTIGSNVSYPLVKSMSPIYLVGQYYTNNTYFSYLYSDVRIHKQGKGFLGFEKIKTTDVTKGIVYENTMGYNSTYYNTYPIGQTVKTTTGSIISTTSLTNNVISLGGKRIFPYVSSQTTTDNLTGLSETKVISNFDTYGNPRSVQTTKGGLTETQTISYTQKGSWCPNKPDSVTTVTTYDGQSETRKIKYYYDDVTGNLTKEIINPNSTEYKVTTEYKGFNAFGQAQTIEVKAKDADGIERTRSSSMTYTSSGTSKGRFVTSKTNVLGETTTYDWDETRGLLNSETTKGKTTYYTYDGFGRLKETRYADGNRKTQVLQWASTGNAIGAKYYSYDQVSGSAPVTTWYDALGREIQKDTYGLNDRKISVSTEYYTYGANKGRLYRVSEPYFEGDTRTWAQTYSVYDAYGRPTTVQTPMGNTTTAYDGLSTTVTTPEGTKTTTLNNAGFVASSTVNGKAVSYTYYPSGLTKTATPEGGQTLSMEYNLPGKRTKLTDPDAGVIETKYNGFGELVEEKQKVHSDNFIVTTHHYEPTTGRLNNIYRNGEITTYTYDVHNRLDNIEIAGKHKQIFVYDALDRVIHVQENIGSAVFVHSTDYDALGRIKKETFPSGYYTINHYDNNYGFLTEVKDKYGRQLWKAVQENAKGQLTEVQRGGKTTTFDYDSRGFPARTTANDVMDYMYTFNNKGNLSMRYDVISDQEEDFNYDIQNRLKDWYISLQGSLEGEYHMSYDANGNVIQKSDLGVNNTLVYGENGKPHALTSISGVPTNFPTTDQNVTYTDFKKIKTLTEGDKFYEVTYGIDDQRRKSEYKLNGITQKTKYYLGDYEEETDNLGNIKKIHYLSGGAILIITNGVETLYYGYSDYQGNLIALANESGAVVERYAFDPWGKRRNPADWTQDDTRTGWIIDRGYTMHEHLDAFGVINMNGRVYDPLTAMFFSPDPFVQAPGNWLNYNRYGYCHNNPLIYTDPSGELIWIIPNIGWSKSGGLSIGISVVVGIPGGLSAQAGIGYSFGSNDAYGYVGATAAMNTISASYSLNSGGSVGYTAGLSPFSGLPISTNFGTVGVNYNISHNSWSGNVSAWQVDQSGWTFNPSVSVMLFPEQTTNLVRGGKFINNDAMLKTFKDAGNYQGALDYFGFKGTYDPGNEIFNGGSDPGAVDPKTGEIYFNSTAFNSTFDKLYFVADHEGRHSADVRSGKYDNLTLTKEIMAGEEFNTWAYNYRRQGLYRKHGFDDIGDRLNSYGTVAGINPDIIFSYSYYQPKWHVIYRIPRRW